MGRESWNNNTLPKKDKRDRVIQVISETLEEIEGIDKIMKKIELKKNSQTILHDKELKNGIIVDDKFKKEADKKVRADIGITLEPDK